MVQSEGVRIVRTVSFSLSIQDTQLSCVFKKKKGPWTIWKATNDAVFNGVAPRVDRALLLAREEAELWMLAGTRDLSGLVAHELPN